MDGRGKIEAFSRSSTSTPGSPRQQGAKSPGRAAKVQCHNCGKRGHYANDCHRKKGGGRGDRGAGSDGSHGGGGSSQSRTRQQKQQQQQGQRRQQGPSSSGSGAAASTAAPQWTGQVGSTSVVSSAAVEPVVSSAAVQGAVDGAAPAGPSVGPWSAGWASYPPAIPFETAAVSQVAPQARPWRQVGIAAPRSAEEVPVEFADKYVPAELGLPGQRGRGAIALRAILDSGAHFTSLSLPIVEMLERILPGVQLRIPFSLGARQAVTASGGRVDVTERCLLYTSPSPRD